MPDPESFEHLRPAIDPAWDDARQERMRRRVKRVRRRRQVHKRVAGVAAVVAALGLGGWLTFGRGTDEPVASASPLPVPDGDGVIHFEDGSRIAALSRDSRIVVTDVTSTQAAVRLRQGAARFEISPNRDRDFYVHCAAVTVSVKGTEFDVRREGSRVQVTVYQGLVEVEWPGGSRELRPGEDGVFPPTVEERDSDPATEAATDEERPSFGRYETPRGATERRTERPLRRIRRAGPERNVDHSGWRTLATLGEYSAAYDALAAGQTVDDRVEDLMLAADSARLSGRPEAALEYLEQVSERHGHDPRAALAAFTIGRIRLGAGETTEAARWFRTAREAQPNSSLAEHALAREIQALSTAGETGRAIALARMYLERFGDGPRAAMVRQLTGL